MGVFIITSIILVVADQIFKILAQRSLMGQTIDWGFIKFSYVEHYSKFLDMSTNIVLIIVTFVILIFFVKFFFTKFTKIVHTKLNSIPFILIVSGGISNIIDRIARGYIIDYVELPYILSGIIFNLADVCIIFGIIALAVLYMIYVTEEKIDDMPEGFDKNVRKKSFKEWIRDYFKTR